MEVYTFKVALDFDKRIYRVIEICGNQTVDSFHDIIFDAFDRYDEHLYSFYLTRKAVKSVNRRYDFTEYTNSEAAEEGYSYSRRHQTHDAYSTKIKQLELNVKDKLYYLFDFGDSWWHEITLLSIRDLNIRANNVYLKKRMHSIPENDWNKLRAMKEELLQVACGRILARISTMIDMRTEDNHQTYLRLWKTMKKEDGEMANMFDDFKRSTAILKLAAWYHNELIDKETLQQFSEATREAVELISQSWRE